MDFVFCWASRYDNVKILDYLLRVGVDVNGEVWGGFIFFIWAVMFFLNLEVLQIFLQVGSYINYVFVRYRQIALYVAVIRGYVAFISLLLEVGVQSDVQDRMFKISFFYAVQKSQSFCVALLIKYNCNVELFGWVNGLSIISFILVFIQEDLEIIKMLLLVGVRFNNSVIYYFYIIIQYYKIVEDIFNIEVRFVYLQQQCRVCIRQLFRFYFLQKFREFILLRLLKSFIEILEFDKINEFM